MGPNSGHGGHRAGGSGHGEVELVVLSGSRELQKLLMKKITNKPQFYKLEIQTTDRRTEG